MTRPQDIVQPVCSLGRINFIGIEYRRPSAVIGSTSIWGHVVIEQVTLLAEDIGKVHVLLRGERLQVFVVSHEAVIAL